MVIEVSPVLTKADLPIEVTVSGIVIDDSEEQPLNIPVGISVNAEGMFTVVSLLHAVKT